ncbi:MAG: GNAT family N-acetyltransferase [Rickettsiales bacterium]|nr:GNAT family N-acetyltransferase [Rickettsiales bacterium]
MKDWKFSKGKYYVTYCKNKTEIADIQNLRFQTYREEFDQDFFDNLGTDKDKYDDVYDHLIVIDSSSNKIVGTYRITITNENSYFGKNFDLGANSDELISNSVEVGRLAIDADHRNGVVMFLLFRGIGNYLKQNNKQYLIGAGSIAIPDNETYENYKKSCSKVIDKIANTDKKRVSEEDISILPSIMRTYFKMGCKILNTPHHDPEFKCIDYPVIMNIDHMEQKYVKFFLE